MQIEESFEYSEGPVEVQELELSNQTQPQIDMHVNNDDKPSTSAEKSDKPVEVGSESAKTETVNIFKNMTEKFTNKECCDKAVDKDLADMVNGLFRDAIPDDKYNELVKKYNKPENCVLLTSVRVNQLVWDIFRPESRSLNVKFQAIQASLVKGSTAITQLVEQLAHATTDKAESGNTQQKLLDLSTDALALFGNAHRLLNLRRRLREVRLKARLLAFMFHYCAFY